MRIKSKLLMAALALAASPLAAAAQATPPEPLGPRQEPGWGQRMGPQRSWRMQAGRRARRGRWMRQRMGRHGGMGLLFRNPAFQKRLGLTPEQVSRIQTQQNAFAKARIRSHADLEVKRMELAELLAAEKPDRALIDKKLREVNEEEFAAKRSAIDNNLALRETLTPEQRETLKQMSQELRARQMRRWFDRFSPPERRPAPIGPRRPAPPPGAQPNF